MKKLLSVLSVVLLLSGCCCIKGVIRHPSKVQKEKACTEKPLFHSKVKEDVYLDPCHFWVNAKSYHAPFASITLRVINKKYRSVKVIVKCSLPPIKTILGKENKGLFGERTVEIPARDSKVFVVRGSTRFGGEKVSCRITRVK